MLKTLPHSVAPRLGQRLSNIAVTVVLSAYGLVFAAQQFGAIQIV
ncbi:MAG TPA: hypothetical protein PLA85_11725 [Micropepsaceae bacterium]|nr:hypothetical protein [Micropepsaceae bacterium]HRK72251.1 hypothetical protein [Micropepsaceae bacterium]